MIMGLLQRIFSQIYDFGTNLVQAVLRWLGNALGWLLDKIISFLKTLFKPFLIVIAILFYFLYKVGELVITLFAVILGIGKLLYSLIQGLIVTLAGFTWTPSSPDHGSWSFIIGEVFDALDCYQLDTIAYVIMFVIWITTAYTAIRIISSRGGAA